MYKEMRGKILLFIFIKGKSGSEKSSLLNILELVNTYTSGRYLYKNKDIFYMNENEKAILRNKEIGFVFQNFNILNHFTTYQNI